MGNGSVGKGPKHEILREYDALSTEEKIEELSKVKAEKKAAEDTVADRAMRVSTLESMADVAEHLIKNDEMSTRIFLDLQKAEGKTYESFYASEEVHEMVITLNIFKYFNAGFVPSPIAGRTVRLTDKGHAFQYDGRFD